MGSGHGQGLSGMIRHRPWLGPLGIVVPALGIYAVSFLYPMLRIARMSLSWTDDYGVLHDGFSVVNYSALFASSYSLLLVWHSLVFGVAVSLTTLVLSYPAALFLYRTTSRWKNLLLLVTISPLFISAIVRTYGWTLILSPQGIVNTLLLPVLPHHVPLRLIYNVLGCYIGMVQILMPYMVLSLMSGMGRLQPGHEEAAASLGASRLQTLFAVVVPLTMPGIVLGLMVCFVLSISSFVTPSLLGGGREQLLATEIYNQAVIEIEWPTACTLAVVLLVVFGALIAGYNRLTADLER
jgi:putative spermidine/putrescine transport system permease protein